MLGSKFAFAAEYNVIDSLNSAEMLAKYQSYVRAWNREEWQHPWQIR